MPYLQITIPTTEVEADRLAEALQRLDALAVSLEDAKDNPIFQINPDETPLWQTVHVKALFPEDIAARDLMQTLKVQLEYEDPIDYRIEKIADQDWVRLTQQHFKPQCFGDTLWVCPTWDETPHSGALLRIDPGLAFGTGTHPTTHLCLEWLATHDMQNKTVLDYGCGSGILALAALVLGAHTVYATDHDEQALTATNNNAALNSTLDLTTLQVMYPEQLPKQPVDIIVANILCNPLIELEPTLAQHSKPGGTLLLSGILEYEIPRIVAAYQNDFTLQSTITQEEWACLVFQRTASRFHVRYG